MRPLMAEAATVSVDRAQSLGTRFENEGLLLDKAWQKPWFGWGRFGRSRVYNDWGKDDSLTDGEWIITIGTFGIVGFVAQFGLLSVTVFRAAASLKFAPTRSEGSYLAALALIVAINMIDLLPNSSISPWSWLLAGALLGRAEALKLNYSRRVMHKNLNVPAASIQEARTWAI